MRNKRRIYAVSDRRRHSEGLATYKTMRSHATTTAIIILSGETDRDVVARALKLGADSYLIKGQCDGNRIAIAVLSAVRNYMDDRQRTQWVGMSDDGTA